MLNKIKMDFCDRGRVSGVASFIAGEQLKRTEAAIFLHANYASFPLFYGKLFL